MANPLRLLESSEDFARSLPPFFVTCGTDDPLLHDSERLERALLARSVPHQARYYHGEIHAFHAMWWRASSKTLWQDTRSFLTERLGEQTTTAHLSASLTDQADAHAAIDAPHYAELSSTAA